MSQDIQNEKKRFFRDELEISEDGHPSFNTSLSNKESFLFSENAAISEEIGEDIKHSEITNEQERAQPSHTIMDLSKSNFIREIKDIIPNITSTVLDDLYDRFPDTESKLSSAIMYYFEHLNKKTEERKESENYESDSDISIIEPPSDNPPSSPSHISVNKNSLLSQKRQKKEHVNIKTHKRFKRTFTWKRFIGSLQVNGMATRPTASPLKYGTKLQLTLSTSNGSPSKIYDSRGKQKKSMSSYVRIMDVQSNREIGRVPEDIAKIVYPLIDTDEIAFTATLVYCDSQRLRVGDSFVLQLDCFLTSLIMEKRNSLSSSPALTSTSFRQSWDDSKISETEDDLKNRSRRMAFINLFDKLNIHQVLDEKLEIEKHQKWLAGNCEVIDIADDETFDLIMSQEHTPLEGTQHQEDTMNLNQLKTFYNAAQSAESLKNLPETDPPKADFKFTLRRYQKQGLSWMLRREHEFEKVGLPDNDKIDMIDGDMMNPLWKQFKWPRDMSWDSLKQDSRGESFSKDIFFYANLHTGEFSEEKPVIKTMMKGGILADEMGLGKTISALSLIFTAPHDNSERNNTLFEEVKDEQDISIINQTSTRPYASKTTLIVVPMSLLHQWYSEFEAVNNSSQLHAEIYYGGNVSSLKKLLTKTKNPPTVVLTTYGIVQNEWSKILKENKAQVNFENLSGLFSVDFYRVIIDEGHTIRNRATATSRAVMELTSKCRWILTGTPIINRLDDLYSLVKFMDLQPWSQIGYWKSFISDPFENRNFKQAFDVVNAILDPVLLRRTKQMKDIDGKPLAELPEKEIIIEKLYLNKSQECIYKHLLGIAENTVKVGLARGDLLKKYSTILVHILRLRQVCCDIRLIGSQDENDEDLSNRNTLIKDNVGINDILNNTISNSPSISQIEIDRIIKTVSKKFSDEKSFREMECSICTAEPIDIHAALITECSHPFCMGCLQGYVSYQKEKHLDIKCPICREKLEVNRLLTLTPDVDDKLELVPYNYNPRSAKLEALVKHLQLLQDTSPGEQVIVFSQFSSYLDILENELPSALSSSDILIYKFDGRLSLKERTCVLKEFQVKDLSKQKILLLSLKAGGVGLNLTCASYAFMMDPWWSPNMEDQAIDRLHRIGQTHNVKIYRFIIANSIEEKMLRIQERKRMIGEAMDASEDERRARRIEEVKMLFE